MNFKESALVSLENAFESAIAGLFLVFVPALVTLESASVSAENLPSVQQILKEAGRPQMWQCGKNVDGSKFCWDMGSASRNNRDHYDVKATTSVKSGTNAAKVSAVLNIDCIAWKYAINNGAMRKPAPKSLGNHIVASVCGIGDL